ncbi:dihydrodipicolinate synthase family protein [Paenibacillus thalictri]|uniref:Dihydrodipicolinate synthase family protein n=1 Tax=Paenibacillus thalictri TaxID=2527873 RepID=A0A4Q9DKD2_9BACL|nr:dihydrodipicolinate synthase family protein [Paenibacillus thalictri]TBL75241.1 dihydrodipicolinate synthase family protein [Paenibacillus thalictri]
MQPLQAGDIFGSWATVLLPLNDDESIDYGWLSAELDVLLESGASGIYTNGSAGEFYAQSEAEFERIHELVADRCAQKGMPLQIGASHMSMSISLDRIRRAKAFQPGAIQVILPDWFPVTEEEAILSLQRMAEAADPVGLVLYNPPHAKKVLAPEAYGKLLEAVPGLIGVKTAGGDAAWYEAMRRYRSRMSVFVPGSSLATGFSRGAAGAYSNMACLNPAAAQRWYETMRSDIESALELERRIQSFMGAHIRPWITQHRYSNQAVDKLLAAVGGWADIGTRLRGPYRSIPQEAVKDIRAEAKAIIPEFFD